MKNKIINNNKVFEVILLIVGLLTLVLGIFEGNKETKYYLTVISILAFAITVFLFALENKLRTHSLKIQNGGEGIRMIPDSEYYHYAQKCIKNATQVKATYFRDDKWTLQPYERGYEKQYTNIEMHNKRKKYESYFEGLNNRINIETLKYDWIVYIENTKKLENLIDRVRTTINENAVGIKKDNIKIHILPHSKFGLTEHTEPPLSQINIQIAENGNDKNLLVAPMKDRLDFNSSIMVNAITDETKLLCKVYEEWFDLIKKQSIPIIDNRQVNIDNIIKQGLLLGLNKEHMIDEVQYVLKNSQANEVRYTYTMK